MFSSSELLLSWGAVSPSGTLSLSPGKELVLYEQTMGKQRKKVAKHVDARA